MKKLLITIIFPVTLFVTGCSLLPQPHRIDIQQGNIISQDDVNQLKTGMNRKQVLFVMGSPIINDTFHPNRWDYYYSLERKRIAEPTIHVSLIFLDDLLIRIDGDMKPNPEANTLDNAQRNAVITITPRKEKVGLTRLIDSMINAVKSDDNQPAVQPESISKPQSPSAPGQEKKKSGGFFDSFINLFKGNSGDEPEATGTPAESSSEQDPALQEQGSYGLNLDAFTHSDSVNKASNNEDEIEAVSASDESDTSSEQQAEQAPAGSGWNLDSFIKPYSSDKAEDEQQDSAPVE